MDFVNGGPSFSILFVKSEPSITVEELVNYGLMLRDVSRKLVFYIKSVGSPKRTFMLLSPPPFYMYLTSSRFNCAKLGGYERLDSPIADNNPSETAK